jgi:hypothetical protein
LTHDAQTKQSKPQSLNGQKSSPMTNQSFNLNAAFVSDKAVRADELNRGVEPIIFSLLSG